jgi:formylglycine-generating enzyme required for sulfatase activity
VGRAAVLGVVLSVAGAASCTKGASRPDGGGPGAAGAGGAMAGGASGSSVAGAGGGAGQAAGGGSGGIAGQAPGGGGVAGQAAGGGGGTTIAFACNVSPTSCADLPHICGPNHDGDCCESDLVPGGDYQRDNSAGLEATVRTFCLDKYEITVGRFRSFVAAYPGSRPAVGAGKNPNNPNDPGWDPAWDSKLPADPGALSRTLGSEGCSPFRFWSPTPGAHEDAPINCVSWFFVYAFCAWDGGWLPTRVEWDYAARGGAEQRTLPWSVPPSDRTLDPTYATYDCAGDGVSGCDPIWDENPVGVKPKGNGRFGQSDLIGNVMEWLQDWASTGNFQLPCVECADLASGTRRELRGGSATSYAQNLGAYPDTTSYTPETTWAYIGARCARAPAP